MADWMSWWNSVNQIRFYASGIDCECAPFWTWIHPEWCSETNVVRGEHSRGSSRSRRHWYRQRNASQQSWSLLEWFECHAFDSIIWYHDGVASSRLTSCGILSKCHESKSVKQLVGTYNMGTGIAGCLQNSPSSNCSPPLSSSLISSQKIIDDRPSPSA